MADGVTKLGRANRAVLLSCVMIVAGMGGMAYASVPLYRLFCQVTGLGGVAQKTDTLPGQVASDRIITVRFDTTVNDRLGWSFEPEQRSVRMPIGETSLVTFRARNLGSARSVGTATFNVSPIKAGPYFDKIECFCFTEQALEPGERAELPVSFFLDPELLKDRNLDDVETITLSYTFFAAKTPQQDKGERAKITAGAIAPDTATRSTAVR